MSKLSRRELVAAAEVGHALLRPRDCVAGLVVAGAFR
jgi:hypothetical protein